MRRGAIKECFEKSGQPLSIRHGRRPNDDIELLKEHVSYFYDVEGIRMDYQRTTESIAGPDDDPPYWTVRRILYPCQIRKAKVNNHAHLFEATYVD